jgi:hypothetical protein
MKVAGSLLVLWEEQSVESIGSQLISRCTTYSKLWGSPAEDISDLKVLPSIDHVLYNPNSLCYNGKEGRNTGKIPSHLLHLPVVCHNQLGYLEK